MNWFKQWVYRRRHQQNIIIPSPEDKRDFKYKRTGTSNISLIDLRDDFNVKKNQYSINCCFAFAGNALIQAMMFTATGFRYEVSASYNYYWTRIYEQTYPANVGAYIRSYFKALYKYGFVLEENMPFKNNATYEPTNVADTLGNMNKELFLKAYTDYRLVSKGLVLDCLNKGQPLIFGIDINSDWYKVGRDGIISSTAGGRGGHAVTLEGRTFIDGELYAIVGNSWGPSWGDNGYCYIPWKHFTDKSFDTYTVNYK